jgi:hypothetical protein
MVNRIPRCVAHSTNVSMTSLLGVKQVESLLRHPVFVAATAVLAVNDHIAKQRWPGIITGKLSDFAGVILVAVVLMVVTRRAAVTGWLTAIGFLALKTMPAIAVLAAPVLGGVTNTDRTDLIALTALAPLVRWLRAYQPPSSRSTAHSIGNACALALALLAVTATAQEAVARIGHFWVSDSSIHAQYDRSYPEVLEDKYVVSIDGGRTWSAEPAPSATKDASSPATSACITGGMCFRVISNGVEVKEAGGPWTTSFTFSAEQTRRLRLTFRGSTRTEDWYSEIAAVRVKDGDYVVVAMGDEGVLVRYPDGSWNRNAVLDHSPSPFGGPSWRGQLLIAPVVLLAVTIASVAVWRPRSSLSRGAAAISIVSSSVLTLAAGATLATIADRRSTGPVFAALSVGMLIVTLPMWAAGRRQDKKVARPPELSWPSIPPKA